MRLLTLKSILFAASALMALLCCTTLQANTTLMLTGNFPSGFSYRTSLGDTEPVGPYTATLTDTATLVAVQNVLVFCLDLHKDTFVGADPPYSGTEYNLLDLANRKAGMPDALLANIAQEEEVAFLTAYSLYLDPNPSLGTNLAGTVEGPISFAIWEIMATLNQKGGTTKPDPLAQPYIQFAQYAYTSHKITDSFLSGVSIWYAADQSDNGPQNFMIGAADNGMIRNALPEPGTLVLLGTGVLLMALSLIRRRRAEPPARALAIHRQTRI